MFFSEYYEIDSSVVEHYGAVDISFVCDIPFVSFQKESKNKVYTVKRR